MIGTRTLWAIYIRGDGEPPAMARGFWASLVLQRIAVALGSKWGETLFSTKKFDFDNEIWWKLNHKVSNRYKQSHLLSPQQNLHFLWSHLPCHTQKLKQQHSNNFKQDFKQFQTRFHLISQIFADSLPPGSSRSGPNENVEKSGTTGPRPPRPHMGIPARAEELSSNSK